MLLEYDRTPNIFRERLAAAPPDINDGRVYVSDNPGLGIEIDESLIEKYRIG